MKRFALFFVLILLVGAISGCDEAVSFSVNFVVDETIYATVGTGGNETISMPENPTKDNYSFDGWYWDQDVWQRPFTANSLLDAPLSSDMNVYAKFSHVHRDTDWRVTSTVAATEDTNGRVTYTCSVCGATKTEKIDKLPHVHVYSQDWATSATHHWHECAKEGDKSGYEEHTFDGGVIMKDATEYEYGKMKYTCTKCGYFYEENTPKLVIDRSDAEIVTAKGFTMTENAGTISLSNATEVYSFINQITVSDYATWVISTDIYGMNTVVTKTISLHEGDNIVYILVTSGDGNNINLYTMTIRRRPMYSVEFVSKGGTEVNSQSIEESFFAEEPITKRAGYTFLKWDYDFEKPISCDTTISAIWSANTDTAYEVRYYLQNLEDDLYTLFETEYLTGTTDTVVNAEIKTYDHFTYNSYISDAAGVISGDGSLILYIGYIRNKYSVTIKTGDACVSIPNKVEDIYKYGTIIDASVATYLDLMGYDGWDGWYLNGDKYTDQMTLEEFVVDKDLAFIAQSIVSEGLEDFIFSSTKSFITITGVKDLTAKELIVPDMSGLSIRDGSFYGCSCLESLTFPSLENHIGRYFGEESFSGAMKVSYWTPGAIEHCYYVPTSLKKMTILKRLSSFCCAGLRQLKTVVLGDDVTDISMNSFENCKSLTSIIIGSYVTKIGDDAFWGCSSLVYFNMPNNVTKIGNKAFYDCTSLTSINIPENVTAIGDSAFDGCSSLVNINIPNNVTIGKYAFSRCNSLSDIILPNNIRTISEGLFQACVAMTCVIIGINVKGIGAYCFYGCKMLTDIYYLGTLAQWKAISKGYQWDTSVPIGCIIHCTDGDTTWTR